MAAQGIAQQMIADQTIQASKPFAHVPCARRQIDTRSRAHSEHDLRSFQNADQLLQYSSIESTLHFDSAITRKQHCQTARPLALHA